MFVEFQAVMTSATVWCNGARLAEHVGGYLPFSVELTDLLVAGDNVLAVRVDATPQGVPPARRSRGASGIDFLQPGGIHRDVTLRTTGEVHIADVHARPHDVLTAPGLDVEVALDRSSGERARPVTVTAALLAGDETIARATTQVTGAPRARLSLGDLPDVRLWSPEDPALYDVRVTVSNGRLSDVHTIRTGFREARFTDDGFQLNGSRYEIFGLNRHGLYPYLGMAAPRRLQRRDAEILRHELSCNMVRCSHYPQSGHFLDACDELGLMVWEEAPGWQHVGGRSFRRQVRCDVEGMIRRDRSRPSVIVWGTRLNESADHPRLYAATRRIAADLDPTRQTTGAMDIHSTAHWDEDVFAYDDYSPRDGDDEATLRPALPGVPYLVSEAVGALSAAPRYRWIDSPATLALQARMHARVHSIAGADPTYAGLLGWCGVDYQSCNGGDRIWRALKTPGVLDTFRVAKPAAGVYASRASPSPMIAPAFVWDVGPGSPPGGPGAGAMIFTDCDRLDVYIGDARTPTLTGTPDRDAFPGLAHPPVFLDFPTLDPTDPPALRIDGLIGDRVVAVTEMSADPTGDVLALVLGDPEILADGTDMTRFTARIVDRHGHRRPLGAGSELAVAFTLTGPGALIADNPFPIGADGGVAGGFVRGLPGRPGTVILTASCPGYPAAVVTLRTVAGETPGAPLGEGRPRVIGPSR